MGTTISVGCYRQGSRPTVLHSTGRHRTAQAKPVFQAVFNVWGGVNGEIDGFRVDEHRWTANKKDGTAEPSTHELSRHNHTENHFFSTARRYVT